MEVILFYILASVAVVSAFIVVVAKNPIHSACWLIMTFLSLAAIYILLHAEFIAALQVLIYAGAMIVLIVFAVFVINLEREEFEIKWHLQTPLAYLIAAILFFEISVVVKKVLFDTKGKSALAAVNKAGNTEAIATQLFSKYVFPFEVISVLLLAAMIGAVVMARKEKRGEREA